MEQTTIAKKIADLLSATGTYNFEKKYAILALPSTISALQKSILASYQALFALWDNLTGDEAQKENLPFSLTLLWEDLCKALVDARLAPMTRTSQERLQAAQNIFSALFPLPEGNGGLSPAQHYELLQTELTYQQYFTKNYDLMQDRVFWTWLGMSAMKQEKKLLTFTAVYEQLSLLLAYLLYQEKKPQNLLWLHGLEIEHQAMERLRQDYMGGLRKKIDYSALCHPVLGKGEFDVLARTAHSKQSAASAAAAEQSATSASATEQSATSASAAEQSPTSASTSGKAPGSSARSEKTPAPALFLADYLADCRTLTTQDALPPSIRQQLENLYHQLCLLQDQATQFSDFYQPDLSSFCNTYIPGVLNLVNGYLQFSRYAATSEALPQMQQEILLAMQQLQVAIDNKLQSIQQYTSMGIIAEARALDHVMRQDGYV